MGNRLLRWKLDEHGTLNLRFKSPGGHTVHAWIEPRNAYCDRGHWKFMVQGLPHLDQQDSFPRYYMSLDAAIDEADSWLLWRLWQQRKHRFDPAMEMKIMDGSIAGLPCMMEPDTE